MSMTIAVDVPLLVRLMSRMSKNSLKSPTGDTMTKMRVVRMMNGMRVMAVKWMNVCSTR